MEKIETEDGSISFRNSEYDECYHTKSGAVEESFEKFANPCMIKKAMKVLDVCFGIGYNTLAAIHIADVDVTALENDPNIIGMIKDVDVAENLREDYSKIKKAAESLYYKDEKISIRIIMGDARKTVKELDEKFDAVFFDPFSPKKCPELWTAEFISDVASKMKKGAVLTTYSCARAVRENLKSAGFTVKDGPCIGRRSPSTIAFLE